MILYICNTYKVPQTGWWAGSV